MTLQEANAIQKIWMECDTGNSEQVKIACREFNKLPKSYFSLSRDGTMAVAMSNGVPLNFKMPVEECLEHYGHQIKSLLAWQCDKWILLKYF